MGDPRKKHKKYKRPKKPFDKERIKGENILIRDYGLKNKKEIWRAEAFIGKIRGQAKSIINDKEKQKTFLEKLKKFGFQVASIDDVLGLHKEDLLERRLQTLLVRKKIANTLKQARQFITHKHILVGEKVVSVPSFIVPTELENKIKKK